MWMSLWQKDQKIGILIQHKLEPTRFQT